MAVVGLRAILAAGASGFMGVFELSCRLPFEVCNCRAMEVICGQDCLDMDVDPAGNAPILLKA